MIKIIQVSNKDIVTGIGQNCFECPIARAITRRVKKGVIVNVGNLAGMVDFTYNDPVAEISYTDRSMLPKIAYDWYLVFDYPHDKLDINPIRFELDIPNWALI